MGEVSKATDELLRIRSDTRLRRGRHERVRSVVDSLCHEVVTRHFDDPEIDPRNIMLYAEEAKGLLDLILADRK